MNRITVGNVYVANHVFTGTSTFGPYEIITVVDERGKDPITIFATEKCIPTGISKGDKFRLNTVTEVAHYWTKGMIYNKQTRQKEEGWEEKFNINADVMRISNDLDGVDTSVLDGLNDVDGELPWEDGDLPL